MKRQGSTELPRFAVGALAIAGASAANGATVQITFADNVVSLSSGINNFVLDLTGDTVIDLFASTLTSGVRLLSLSTALIAQARTSNGTVQLAGRGNALATDRALVPFVFTDIRINGPAATNGFLDVEGWATGFTASLKIHRLIFDDASTTAPTGLTSASTGIAEWSAVPEPSSLGLLALGAGGLLARRRRAA